ncbi:MAG: hypothetical protein RSE14_03150 [Erythrobacter sp.]|jgi:hypothetical protein|uniref:hypothetical protein n=1 Tax=Erythrobacter sp. TaxID=1042 RepID=UPI002B469D2A|nr:hypothetical protein [Erythrobacter sp.]WRH71106.1 MAG: hypothetical protein RSE14_03150 [Erythrobacter sp.]
MGDETMDLADGGALEAALRDELARETRALGSLVPVLRHMLASDGHRLVSDAALARVRGMLSDLAAQLLAAAAGRDPSVRLPADADRRAHDALADALAGDPLLLAHCHALAAESLTAERLHQHHGLDPVLSPLLQELIAAEDPLVAELAMNTLAAQSRFIQSQRRMELPLSELPAELFHALTARHLGQGDAARRLHETYDEGASRLGLLARLVSAMRRGAIAALALDHAGLALFASAVAALGREEREDAVLACQEGQGARLALMLRSAGMSPENIARIFPLVDPASRAPQGLEDIAPERARLLLGLTA